MKTLLAFFIILFFEACSNSIFTGQKSHIAPTYDVESRKLKEEYFKGRNKSKAYLYAMCYDTSVVSEYEIDFFKEDTSFYLRMNPGRIKDTNDKDKKFRKFYYGKYVQRKDTFYLAFVRVEPVGFKNYLYYTSTRTNLIANDNGRLVKLHLWKRNFDFLNQKVKPKYWDYTDILFVKRR